MLVKMPSLTPANVLFPLLSLLGFYNLWIRMLLNGTIDALDHATKTGAFPDGHPLLNTFFGIPPVDNAIATLVGFFDGMTNGSDPGSRLLYIEAVSTLQVAILWLMTEALRTDGRKFTKLLMYDSQPIHPSK